MVQMRSRFLFRKLPLGPVAAAVVVALLASGLLGGCAAGPFVEDTEAAESGSGGLEAPAETQPADSPTKLPDDEPTNQEKADKVRGKDRGQSATRPDAPAASGTPDAPDTSSAAGASSLEIHEDFRDGFIHGDKPADCQRYIVLHDTESDGSAQDTIDWWDSNGNLVAAHFIVNKDGSIWQCVPLDSIAHHAGYGDTGHNALFGAEDESRDDKRGTTPIGDDYADYGMNSYSIGIEMVHAGGDYPAAQLDAVDDLIAYIDNYYGFESEIIDHKAWRSGNSDTSEEFAPHLRSYQTQRTHA